VDDAGSFAEDFRTKLFMICSRILLLSKETMPTIPLRDAFYRPKLKQELANPHSKFFLLQADDTLASI
jgi:hypothetical protein